jgi:hypothetical protein
MVESTRRVFAGRIYLGLNVTFLLIATLLWSLGEISAKVHLFCLLVFFSCMIVYTIFFKSRKNN